MHRDLVLVAPLFRSMFKTHCAAILPAVLVWPGPMLAAPAGTLEAEARPSLRQHHLQRQRSRLRILILVHFHVAPSIQQPGPDAGKPGTGRKWFQFHNSEEKVGD